VLHQVLITFDQHTDNKLHKTAVLKPYVSWAKYALS